jgi:hypothetical protein
MNTAAQAPTLAGLTAKLKAELDRKAKAERDLAKIQKVLAEADERIEQAHKALREFTPHQQGYASHQ